MGGRIDTLNNDLQRSKLYVLESENQRFRQLSNSLIRVVSFKNKKRRKSLYPCHLLKYADEKNCLISRNTPQWQSIYINIYMCVCVCVRVFACVYIYPLLINYMTWDIMYDVHTIRFQTVFVCALLLIVHTWNSIPLPSNPLRLQCTCYIVPRTSGKPHRNPLV